MGINSGFKGLNETKEKSMSSSKRIDARQSSKCQQTAIGHRAVQVVKHLGFQKVCARWVPRLLTEGTNLEKKIQLTSQLHEQYAVEGDYFHYSNVWADGSWFHCFNWERKP